MHARLKTPVLDVWQYYGQPLVGLPRWVSLSIEIRPDGVYLMRRSGLQRIESTDWLVQEASGELLWMPDADFRSQYELFSPFSHPTTTA